MLGLLLLAGLGVAAAALVEHVDSTDVTEDPEPDQPEEEAGSGDLLDDIPATQGEEPAEEKEPEAFPEGQSDPLAEGDPAATPEVQPETPAEVPAEAPSDMPAVDPGAQSLAAPPAQVQHGGPGSDSIEGTTGRDYLDGGEGNDILQGRGGADRLVTLSAGSDTAFGGMGADSLHGYTVNAMPGGDTSFVIEDHAADHLHGGLGADKLWLGSDDVGTGGAGADEFHLSWDIDHANPATITDYRPATDRIVIEFTTNHADGDMDPITGAEQNVTTQPLDDGSGTAICLNGQPVAHVLGTTTLRASDISVVHL